MSSVCSVNLQKKLSIRVPWLWKVKGRPHQGHTSEMRRVTRARYHRVLKMVKKDHDIVRKEKMAEAVYNNNSRDLFAEVRRMNARKSLILLVLMVWQGGDQEISQLFSNKYEQLYNSVPCDSNVLRRLRGRLMKEY